MTEQQINELCHRVFRLGMERATAGLKQTRGLNLEEFKKSLIKMKGVEIISKMNSTQLAMINSLFLSGYDLAIYSSSTFYACIKKPGLNKDFKNMMEEVTNDKMFEVETSADVKSLILKEDL